MSSDDARGTVTRIGFDALGRFSDLYRTYCSDYPSLADFFAGDFRRDEVLRRAMSRTTSFDRDRETLVSVLKRQNEQWGASEDTLRNIARLGDADSVAVVTGQQVGLLTGPLYTALKTITALQVSREMEARTGKPCIPVFWLEGEDHDVAEATSVALPTDDGPVRFRYEPSQAAEGFNAGPVGRLDLDSGFAGFLREVEEALPPTEFRDEVIGAVEEAYRTGDTLLSGFARYLRRLFPTEGLVFLSPDDPDLKSLLKPLFEQELREHAGSYAALMRATERISGPYSAQIHPRPGNLFLLEEEGRVRLDPDGDSFHLRGLDRDLPAEEALALLESDPGRFSSNVALRPLAQDTLLPTAVYVAGPGEVAYFAQLKGLYEWAGIPMPVIYPRASATFVEKRIRRVLDRYELDVPALSGDVHDVIRNVVLGSVDVDVEAVFGDAESTIGTAMGKLKAPVVDIDASLGKTVDATRTGIIKQIEQLKGKTIRSARRQQDQISEAIMRASNHLFPDGQLQERTVSPLYLMTKYGSDLPSRWIHELSTDTTEHQIIEITG